MSERDKQLTQRIKLNEQVYNSAVQDYENDPKVRELHRKRLEKSMGSKFLNLTNIQQEEMIDNVLKSLRINYNFRGGKGRTTLRKKGRKAYSNKKGGRLTTKKRHKKSVSPSPWIKHVRKCMKKYNLTYNQAIRDARVRNLYYLGRTTP